VSFADDVVETPGVSCVLPKEARSGSMILRCWRVLHAAVLSRLITANVDHLHPWMPWIADEPLTVAERRDLIRGWAANRLSGGDAVYGVFVDGEAVGGCGLHRRIGPSGLEIGYWISAHQARRGFATNAARILTDTAFAVSGVHTVEVHHDQANVASAAIPRRLGFELVAERPDDIEAPGEVGVDCIWRMARSTWLGVNAEHTSRSSPTWSPTEDDR
jgi:ribosomal-protein-serine acetyltransferase